MPIVYSLTLEVIGIFQILTLCLILASGASQKKIDYKKVKTTFGPPLLPIKPPHWTPPLTNLKGGEGVPDHAPPTYAWEGSSCSVL